MNWYDEGKKWADNYWNGTREHYGMHPISHRRRLMALTNTSKNQESARQGFNDRLREIIDLPLDR